jgi:hypothetical protein
MKLNTQRPAATSTKAITESPSHFGLRGRFWIADFRLSEKEFVYRFIGLFSRVYPKI